MALRVIFMGTPQLACESLRALLNSADVQVLAAVTQPDRPSGRELKLQPSPVKSAALSAGIAVLQPERARHPEFIARIKSLQPDLIAVAAFGQILPQSLLDIARLGCLNVHTSLLPKYRGAAPIQWAILNDEPETGITIMKMDAGLDTGDILTQEKTTITPGDTSETLHDRLADIGAALLSKTIPDYAAGKIIARPQPADGVSYARKITREDGKIDWNRPARAIWNQVRGLVPWPGAFTFMSAGPKPQLLKIWQAEPVETSGTPGVILWADKSGIVAGCGEGSLRILQLQREGGKKLTAQQFLAGQPLNQGSRFGA
jgi:methionyl-tRNA formyltransferase